MRVLATYPADAVRATVVAVACVCLSVGSAAAQSQRDVLLHGSALSYSLLSAKEGGHTAGVYASYGSGLRHFTELGGTLTRVRYHDGYRLEQTDLAAAYSRFWAHGSARLGAHLIDSTDPLTDGGLVLFSGLSAYRPGVWSVGAEGALSSYAAYDGGLTVAQVAPSAGLSLGSAYGGGAVGAVVRGYYIRLSRPVALNARNFASAEAALAVTVRELTLSGTAWAGEQAFAVRSGGFLVFNLAEVHTGGYGGGARWVVTPTSALSAGIYIERFRDDVSTASFSARAIAISLGITI
jgi:hypothetical protein